MSQQDSHFFNMFSLVLGTLIGIAILLFALAKIVGASTQLEQVKLEPEMINAIDQRTKPFARVAVAGQDNTALAIKDTAGQAPALALAVPQTGEELYNAACTACHGQGIAGAPKMGDKAAWVPRIAEGKDVLYQHAIGGFQGKTGMMPPKGGRVDLSDDVIRLGVDYMVEQSK